MFNPKIVICLFLFLLVNQARILSADETVAVGVDKQANQIAGEVTPMRPSAIKQLTSDSTFNQTHAFIRTLILNEGVVYEQPLATNSSVEIKHWHDVDYGITSYSADKCQIVYGRSLRRSAVHGHAEYRSRKGVSFNMTQVDRITLNAWSDFDPQIGRSKSLPSEMIMFYGPATVMINGEGSTRTSHGMTVYSSSSARILEAFQHLKKLCTP